MRYSFEGIQEILDYIGLNHREKLSGKVTHLELLVEKWKLEAYKQIGSLKQSIRKQRRWALSFDAKDRLAKDTEWTVREAVRDLGFCAPEANWKEFSQKGMNNH